MDIFTTRARFRLKNSDTTTKTEPSVSAVPFEINNDGLKCTYSGCIG